MAPSKDKQRTLLQNTMDDCHSQISLQDELMESSLTEELFAEFFEDCPSIRFVGLAPIYTERGDLSRLAIAVSTKALIVHFAAKGKGQSAYLGRKILQSQVLCNADVMLLAFDFAELAIALFIDQGLRVLNGVDIQSACGTDRSHSGVVKFAVGDRARVYEENVAALFQSSVLEGNSSNLRRTTPFALQAWLAQSLSGYDGMEERFRGAPMIDTMSMDELQLYTLAHLERGQQRLTQLQATSTAHEYQANDAVGKNAHVRAKRYQTRMRQGTVQHVTVHDNATGHTFVIDGAVQGVKGRNAKIETNTYLEARQITSIVTQGRDGPTRADRARSLNMLHAMQGRHNIFDNPFLQYIFNPSPDFAWPEDFPVLDSVPDIVTTRPLNDSQQHAVEHMLSHSNDTRLTIIRGPPGTGKTTVIAAFVCSAVAAGFNGIWLVAQSNIAVKNIAEKLAAVNFHNWRLLVSNDFHYDWHAHIYQDLVGNIITSDQFKPKLLHGRVEGVPVTLCTLSMLSNSQIHLFTRANPIKTIVIDEASQITLGDYVAPLQTFTTISKMCMIGDDKQLPPYGANQDENMKSIFEIEHLRPSILLLSIQYRMPPVIGEVVSDVVYEGQLQSNPNHPVPSTQTCCWFVDVKDSHESQLGTSWANAHERAAVIKVAEKLQAEDKEFCIITPYDAQRTALENDLKDSGLDWEDKCFNVDSFQGNERDYVIVSLVRTRGLGFLDDLRRTNVMLTRCKRGMYIVTQWEFVFGRAAETLVGRMASAWDDDVWVNTEHLTIELEA